MHKIYRKVGPSNDHLPTYDPNEGNSVGYSLEATYIVYSKPYGGNGGTPAPTYPLIRCRITTGYNYHYLQNGTACGPNAVQEIGPGGMGYALQSPRSGFVLLYLCNVPGTNMNFTTTASNCEGQRLVYPLGYVMTAYTPPNSAVLSVGYDNTCLGRCGAGCNGWMPMMNIYTAECRAHDDCVNAKGMASCMPEFFVAAVSYDVNTYIVLGKAVGKVVSHLMGW